MATKAISRKLRLRAPKQSAGVHVTLRSKLICSSRWAYDLKNVTFSHYRERNKNQPSYRRTKQQIYLVTEEVAWNNMWLVINIRKWNQWKLFFFGDEIFFSSEIN
jgi:hypothetical protein